VWNTPAKAAKRPACAKLARKKIKTHRRCKTRPEKCVKSMLVQNTPPVQNTPGKNAKHTVGANHARKKCVKSTLVQNTRPAQNTPGK
jgi:hypothetical protein